MILFSRLHQPTYLIAIGLLIAPLLIYLTTLAPSVVTLFDDSLEFQLVTYRLGIAHPTGYPLYTLLGKLFTLIPVGNIAYRINLMSALFGAMTISILYLIIIRIRPPVPAAEETASLAARPVPIPWPRHVGAAKGALLLAVGLVYWQQATVAEVYSLNAFFIAILFFLALHCSPNDQSLGGVYKLALTAGLALTHHRTILLLFPALSIYLLLIYRTRLLNLRALLLILMFGLLPLLLYLYLPLRGHIGSLDGSYENSWSGFWRQVSASGYGLFIFDNPLDQERDLLFYWNLLADQFYTTVPGFIGLIYLVQRRRLKLLILTGIAFVTYFTFNLFYNVADIEVFFIPVFLIWAIWSGIGAIFLLETAATLNYPAWRWPIIGLLGVIFIFVIGQVLLTNQTLVNQRYTWDIHDYGIDILRQPIDPESEPAIVGILGEMTLIRYFQQTENLRPNIETVAADREVDRLAAVETLLVKGKTIYLTRELPGVAERWSLSAVGPLIKLHPAPILTPPTGLATPINLLVTPEITLLGYTPSRVPHTGQGHAPVRLSLVWQINAPISVDLKVSARLLNAAGEILAVVDGVPVHFAYPTSAWRAGEIITDVYDLDLAIDTPVGHYSPLIILYDPAQNAAEVGRVELDPILIE